MLCEHGNTAPCVECDIEPLQNEIATLRKQLEAKDSDYRAAQEAEKILMDRLDDLRGQLEASQAQCAELSDALLTLRKPWDLGQILGAETRRRVEKADKALSGGHGEAYVLIKQAEVVEKMAALVKEAADANLATPATIYEGLINNAQTLRNQAKELENK